MPAISIDGNQTVLVDGTVVLLPDAVSVINVQGPAPGVAPIQVTGTLILDGELRIIFDDVVVNGYVVPLIGGGGDINGSYTDIIITGPEECKRYGGELQGNQSGGLSVLVSVEDDPDCRSSSRSLSGGAIAGIVVGGVIFIALLALLVLLLVRKLRPHNKLFHYSSKDEKTSWR